MNLRLAGQYHDDETGLNYNIHRYFDPSKGQYISPDPMGTPDGPNRYAYVNGDPMAGIDPLGLFEIPLGALAGNDSYFVRGIPGGPDGGHGDILRIAFHMYSEKYGARFSQSIIDQIIINNYHSDANGLGCYGNVLSVKGGGQCQYTNHFDNPNTAPVLAGAGAPFKVEEYIDPATGKKAYRSTGEYRSTYTNTQWIADAISDVDKDRKNYGYVINKGKDGADISVALGAFGRNSHALADFYAHSNWVDNSERGGCWINPQNPSERGWVPRGLNKSALWEEGFDGDVPLDNLFSGTVGTLNEVKVQTANKSTHAYWGKDTDSAMRDEKGYTTDEQKTFSLKQMTYIQVYQKDGEYKFDRALPIDKRHRMAYYLAVQHTFKEIEKLWDTAGVQIMGDTGKTIHQAFAMTKSQLESAGISYRDLWPKDIRP
jgi:RHS repeat-associated protein